MDKTTGDDLRQKIRQAEESVSEMQDENLKRIAFETILASLLGNHKTGPTSASPHKKSLRSKKVGNRPSGKPRSQQQDKVSTLKLNIEQLKELKSFYDKLAPAGTEEVVFALAYFVHEKLKQTKFHAADVHIVYQNLLPLKPSTRPPAMSLSEIKRAMRWLVVPSRRKQWLNDAGDGMFDISPQGMLRVTYEAEAVKTPKNHA